jgi:hypothetical protein
MYSSIMESKNNLMKRTLFNRQWRRAVLKAMVRERKLKPIERMASRIGYMGAGF